MQEQNRRAAATTHHIDRATGNGVTLERTRDQGQFLATIISS
jgi:hypothetical protein